MIQLMRCAGIAACLMSAGCGWLGIREQESPRPAKAQQPPAKAQKPQADPFAVPTPPIAPPTNAAELDRTLATPRRPLEAEMEFPAGGVLVVESPVEGWNDTPDSYACPCPKCRKARNRWWHWPCRDEDCDGNPQVPCKCLVEAHERAMERVPPVGTFMDAAMETQIANGNQAQMMIYDYDFLPGTAVLNTRGRRDVRKMHHLLMSTPAPLLIQTTPGQPQLDMARRAAVLMELEQNGTPVPSESVVMSEPLTRGLDGLDAAIIHDRLLQQQTGGAPGAGTPVAPSPTIGVAVGP